MVETAGFFRAHSQLLVTPIDDRTCILLSVRIFVRRYSAHPSSDDALGNHHAGTRTHQSSYPPVDAGRYSGVSVIETLRCGKRVEHSYRSSRSARFSLSEAACPPPSQFSQSDEIGRAPSVGRAVPRTACCIAFSESSMASCRKRVTTLHAACPSTSSKSFALSLSTAFQSAVFRSHIVASAA